MAGRPRLTSTGAGAMCPGDGGITGGASGSVACLPQPARTPPGGVLTLCWLIRLEALLLVLIRFDACGPTARRRLGAGSVKFPAEARIGSAMLPYLAVRACSARARA